MAGGGLPRYAVLKSATRNCYVRCTLGGSLMVDEDDVMSPASKLELERASIGRDLLNIRSCYNNKYWAPEGPYNCHVKAVSAKPNEDQSSWTCTTFKHGHQGGRAPFVFIHHSRNLCAKSGHPLFVTSRPASSWCEFVVIDWESLVRLPKHVAFKGDNGKYLAVQWIGGHEYLKFDSSNIGDPRVANEIFPTGDGSVRIKSKYYNKFWKRSPLGAIWADTFDSKTDDFSDDDDTTSNYNKDTLFVPVKIGTNTIALRNLGTDYGFCIRHLVERDPDPLPLLIFGIRKDEISNSKADCLTAELTYVAPEGILTVEEAVSSRKVFNVKYHVSNAKIYDENILTIITREAINNNSVPETHTLRLAYKRTSSTTWQRGDTVSVGVSTTIEAGIPLLVDGRIQINGSFQRSYTWGTTEETSEEADSTNTVTVEPYTRVKATVLATKGKCDVPFTYTVRDVLTDGKVITYNMEDGLYTCTNCYNFRTETTKYKL